ncbi:hypothetical protein F5B19DRAFT_281000 [Rostrohypoxylon terebratum]|nr:hypothetical protein F5B19DRAFT_281000 [Rostrohypoxylon terebratum]
MSTQDSNLTSKFPPPPGATPRAIPNFVGPLSMAPASKAIIAVTFAIISALCMLSAATITSYCAAVFKALDGMMGHHEWNAPPSKANVPLILKDSILTIILYGVSAIFLKSALLSLYLRIFKTVRTARILIWTSLVIITIFYTICFVIDAAICGKFLSHPDISARDSSHYDPEESCSVRQRPIWAAMGVFSVVSDFYLLIIPVVFTMNLRLPLRRKVGVCCMFLTGLIACAFSILATVYRFQLLQSYDFTWIPSLTYAFIAAEINVGVACSCMPATIVFFHSFPESTTWSLFIKIVTCQTLKEGDSASKLNETTVDSLRKGSPEPPQSRKELISSIRKAYFSPSRRTSSGIVYHDKLSSIDYHKQLFDQTQPDIEASLARLSGQSHDGSIQIWEG